MKARHVRVTHTCGSGGKSISTTQRCELEMIYVPRETLSCETPLIWKFDQSEPLVRYLCLASLLAFRILSLSVPLRPVASSLRQIRGPVVQRRIYRAAASVGAGFVTDDRYTLLQHCLTDARISYRPGQDVAFRGDEVVL